MLVIFTILNCGVLFFLSTTKTSILITHELIMNTNLLLFSFPDFEIFTVGIGKGIRMSLLNELASEPPLSHVFILKDYPDLNDVMKIIEDSKPPRKSNLQLKSNVIFPPP